MKRQAAENTVPAIDNISYTLLKLMGISYTLPQEGVKVSAYTIANVLATRKYDLVRVTIYTRSQCNRPG